MKNFKNIKNFIFDCDGVCYLQISDAVFGQVSKRMTRIYFKKIKFRFKKSQRTTNKIFS